MAERNVARSTDRFEKKRDAILDASTVILNTQGVKGLTLGVAAAAVGLSTTSVTYYFKRKDDLAAACLMRGIDWLTQAAEFNRICNTAFLYSLSIVSLTTIKIPNILKRFLRIRKIRPVIV